MILNASMGPASQTMTPHAARLNVGHLEGGTMNLLIQSKPMNKWDARFCKCPRKNKLVKWKRFGTTFLGTGLEKLSKLFLRGC